MATNTYVALRTEVITSAVPSVTFNLSGITGYTDLVVVSSLRITSGGATSDRLQFNGDTASNYSTTVLYGTGSTAGSYRVANQTGMIIDDVTSTEFNTNIHHIMNYANTTTFKTVIGRSSPVGSSVQANVGLWRSTAAITSLTINAGSSTFVAGSTFTIYGIATQAVPGIAKATGGTITYDNFGYVYHTFTGNGTFTPSQALTCDILTVAGGGGGGGSFSWDLGSAGGGAGGLLGFNSQALAATGYSVTIGGGGSGGSSNRGANGTNSTFGALTAAIGGGGGSGSNVAPGNGGSGGGGAPDKGFGTGTSGQGFNGINQTNYGGGSGGGAGGLGTVRTADLGTNGGIGANGLTLVGGTAGPYSFIGAMAATTGTGASGYYAGGGGGGNWYSSGSGGAGGAGGGGTGGADSNAGAAASINTGGGGGGSGRRGTNGGTGGSGIVIVRYYGI